MSIEVESLPARPETWTGRHLLDLESLSAAEINAVTTLESYG